MKKWTPMILMMILISTARGGNSGITFGTYQKSTLPAYAADCTLTTHEVSQYIKNYKTITCSTFCTKDPKCKAFCITGNSCILLDMIVSSGGTSPSGGMTGLCYLPVRSVGPTGVDLVRGKGVQHQEAYSSSYAAIETVVGSEGSRNDDLLATYTDDNAKAGERIIMYGTKTLNGRYVSIWRQTSSSSVCICLLEAYSHL